jgi:hypothetical protein
MEKGQTKKGGHCMEAKDFQRKENSGKRDYNCSRQGQMCWQAPKGGTSKAQQTPSPNPNG